MEMTRPKIRREIGRRREIAFVAVLVFLFSGFLPRVSFAAPDDALLGVYAGRADLRRAFDADDSYRAVDGTSAGYLIDLEDWASQFGWREYPELSGYAPAVASALSPSGGVPPLTADAYVVIDRPTGQIVAAHNAGAAWPVASLTKLMTAQIALDSGKAASAVLPVKAEDDVGGAKLYVQPGDTFTLDGLLYATLVGSANNAANALTRTVSSSKEAFVDEMNLRASALNLSRTSFADPTGIDVANVSTAREMARIADAAFRRPDIRRYTTTAAAKVRVLSQGTVKTVRNTNWMLWKPEYDDIFVMAGKTGYLEESGWNLAVVLRPQIKDEKRELLVVTFGSNSRAESFQDAEALARWAWN
jgi:D-alanyl-D-alanine endopeptidase (penicillin-binding protein 7)